MSSIRIICDNVIHRLAKTWFFCLRFFPVETPQKSPKVAISATTSERCARQQGPSAKGWQHQDSRQQHSPGQQHAQHQHGPSSQATPGSAPGWIRRTVARTRPMAGQQHGSSSTAQAARQPRVAHSPGHQRRAVDRAHGGTHPAKSWPAARAARTRPRAGHQNAPGAVIARRARGCPGLVGLCVLGRLKVNRPLGHARQAQAAILLIAFWPGAWRWPGWCSGT